VLGIRVMASLAGLPLVLMFLAPSIPAAVGVLVLVGVAGSYQVLASTLFVRTVPAHTRGAAVGLAGSVVVASQGLGVLLFGIIADGTGAARASGIAVVAATVMGVLLAAALSNAARRSRTFGVRAPASS
jgi:hypothetical protein